MAVDLAVAGVPAAGVWRVARADKPLYAPTPTIGDIGSRSAGNRYDVVAERTLYFSTSLEGCYTEVLAPLRPSIKFKDMVDKEWRARGWMAPGTVDAAWRHRRNEVLVKLDPGYEFLDVTDPDTLDILDSQLRPALVTWNYEQLDFGLINGPDRRVTQLIAAWASQILDDEDGAGGGDEYRFAGIHYKSRLDQTQSCWAVWADGVNLEVAERRAVERESGPLRAVAGRFGLHVF
jgi:hypothetical protein